jgi:hypothetical protein
MGAQVTGLTIRQLAYSGPDHLKMPQAPGKSRRINLAGLEVYQHTMGHRTITTIQFDSLKHKAMP